MEIQKEIEIKIEKDYIKNSIKWILKKIWFKKNFEEYSSIELYIIILDKLELKNYNRKLIVECINEIISEEKIKNIMKSTFNETQTILHAI